MSTIILLHRRLFQSPNTIFIVRQGTIARIEKATCRMSLRSNLLFVKRSNDNGLFNKFAPARATSARQNGYPRVKGRKKAYLPGNVCRKKPALVQNGFEIYNTSDLSYTLYLLRNVDRTNNNGVPHQ